MDTKLKRYTTSHPQKYGQIEVVNMELSHVSLILKISLDILHLHLYNVVYR
jgi:hypothetical protein